MSFVEVYQNCVVFNDGAFAYATDRQTGSDAILELEHGKPMIFGTRRNKGIRLRGTHPEVVALSNGITENDLAVHDEKAPQPTLAYLLSRMRYPQFPEPIGVFRAVERPVYEQQVAEQIRRETEQKGTGSLEELFRSGDT